MIIVDIDNCISDDCWRIKAINWAHNGSVQRWWPYHQLAAFDKIANRGLLRGHGSNVIISTARPVFFFPLTVEWLHRNDVPFKHLLMRNDNDLRPSVDVKREHVSWLPSLYSVDISTIKAAYDDKQSIVDMYAAMGLPSTRAWIHSTPYREAAL